ncbi:MAG: hypothetical protein Q8P67_28005 [archaeon]|nr:hypothetical protein [archaeon]
MNDMLLLKRWLETIDVFACLLFVCDVVLIHIPNFKRKSEEEEEKR